MRMTVKEFATEVSLAPRTIREYIQVGKIKGTKEMKGNRAYWFVDDVEQAKKDMVNNTSYQASKKAKKGVTKRMSKNTGVKPDDKSPGPEKKEKKEKISIREAERREKVAKAQLAELKLDEAKSILVDAKKVEKDAFELGRKVRDAILNVPNRVSHEAAAETDPHKVEILLNKELVKALEELTAKEKKKPTKRGKK